MKVRSAKCKIVVIPTQFAKDEVPFSHRKLMTVVEFVGEFRNNLLRNFRKYDSATFYTHDLKYLRRPFFLAVLLYWFSRKACFMDALGKKYAVTLFNLVRLGISFIREYLSRFGLKKMVEKQIREIGTLECSYPFNFSCKKGKLLYVAGGKYSVGQAGGSITHIPGVINSFIEMAYSVDYWSGISNPLINGKCRHFSTLDKLRYPNFNELESLNENKVIIDGVINSGYRETPDFIYQRYSNYNFSGLILARRLGIPLVLEFNSSAIWTSNNWGVKLSFPELAEKNEQIMLYGADLITTVSSVLKAGLVQRGIPHDKILVNPNGVDPEVFHPGVNGRSIRRKYKLEGKVIVGFVGTFGPWHGAEILADAITKLDFSRLTDNLHFLFIGDGQRRIQCENIIQSAGLEKYCTFTGMVPQDQSPLYQGACDVMISCHVPNPDGTPFFGSPTKLFEYMAMGKIIIASELDQIADVLEDAFSAVMVRPGGSAELASAITRVVKNPAKYKHLGENARLVVCKDYSWGQHSKRILDRVLSLAG